jgi:hypothetical protein
MYTNVDYLLLFCIDFEYKFIQFSTVLRFVHKVEYVDKISTFIYAVESCIQTEHNIMSKSRTIPVRMLKTYIKKCLTANQ